MCAEDLAKTARRREKAASHKEFYAVENFPGERRVQAENTVVT
jgi:hypothetical protein